MAGAAPGSGLAECWRLAECSAGAWPGRVPEAGRVQAWQSDVLCQASRGLRCANTRDTACAVPTNLKFKGDVASAVPLPRQLGLNGTTGQPHSVEWHHWAASPRTGRRHRWPVFVAERDRRVAGKLALRGLAAASADSCRAWQKPLAWLRVAALHACKSAALMRDVSHEDVALAAKATAGQAVATSTTTTHRNTR